MGNIKQLPEDLIKKIAAGEVIERPASVVKELVENSIDAKATRIEIEVERNAKYIKVSDNGEGIDPDDIPLLFKRHATSKINSFDDLWNINTLGFRGEALASISAVSKIRCLSKHKNSEGAFELTYTDGKINKKTAALSSGTIVEINDLFFSVPARQKFLKTEKTELGHIRDVIFSESLSHSEISFRLSSSKRIILETTGSGDLQQVTYELLGNDLKDKLIFVFSNNHFVSLSGYINSLDVYRPDRKSIFIFINKRPVRCQIISKAIQSFYEGLLPTGKYPLCVLNLQFKPKFVDVNVHPAKREVRYSNPNEVYNFVLHTIQKVIEDYYKKTYKEKAVYPLPEPVFQSLDSSLKTDFPLESRAQSLGSKPVIENYNQKVIDYKPKASYIDAAIELYAPSKSQAPSLFSVSNLRCFIVQSNSPIANLVKTGNKTVFEVGSLYEESLQIVFSGEIIGDDDYKKHFFNFLSELSKGVYENYLKKKEDYQLQKTIVNDICKEEEEEGQKARKKPPEKLLYEVWERDFWTCVYCGKRLLDPKTVKEAMKYSDNAFIDYINKEGNKISIHILKEHSASYDHYYPVSKLPQFNFEKENLFASCFECNRKKSDSMELSSWAPERKKSWDAPLEVAGLCFKSPREFYVVQKSDSLQK